MRRAAQCSFIAVFLLFMSGCGSQSSVGTTPIGNPNPAEVPVSLTITDTPPAGVTVLFFQLSITGSLSDISAGKRFAFEQRQSDPRKCHPAPDGLGFSG